MREWFLLTAVLGCTASVSARPIARFEISPSLHDIVGMDGFTEAPTAIKLVDAREETIRVIAVERSVRVMDVPRCKVRLQLAAPAIDIAPLQRYLATWRPAGAPIVERAQVRIYDVVEGKELRPPIDLEPDEDVRRLEWTKGALRVGDETQGYLFEKGCEVSAQAETVSGLGLADQPPGCQTRAVGADRRTNDRGVVRVEQRFPANHEMAGYRE